MSISTFAADEWADQFMRSLPLLVIPMLIPVNMDMLFIQYGLMFYGYGVYLHWGYEHPKLSSHKSFCKLDKETEFAIAIHKRSNVQT